MKVVIQCAARKSPRAGYLRGENNRKVCFVGHPNLAPISTDYLYASPDDMFLEYSYRERLVEYNQSGVNPWRLLSAYQLYSNPVYADLVQKLGIDQVYILSAGWGLIRANFLTPSYDITFSQSADKYKKRGKRDLYQDFNHLKEVADDDLIFFGGKDYQSLFSELTKNYHGKRFVYYNSAVEPDIMGCETIRYPTATRTNWHYECAKAFLNNRLDLKP